MSAALSKILAILDLERTGENSFRGTHSFAIRNRVFGGQIVGQALVAAARTVEGAEPHSLHGYFLVGGDPSAPIDYEVERLRDGRSFATRRTSAIQHGQPIFTLTCSFHTPEPGLDHAPAMPEVPDPETLMSADRMALASSRLMPTALQRYFRQEQAIEVRPVDLGRYFPRSDREPLPIEQNIWMRANGPLPDDPAVHRAVLAYLSDMTLIDTILVRHQHTVFDPEVLAASLDHAIWFHRPFRADEWLLYSQVSPTAQGGRGLARGNLFSRDGRLVASVIQEGLMRLRVDKPTQ
jgi:acyl-CoA thioesterase-2